MKPYGSLFFFPGDSNNHSLDHSPLLQAVAFGRLLQVLEKRFYFLRGQVSERSSVALALIQIVQPFSDGLLRVFLVSHIYRGVDLESLTI